LYGQIEKKKRKEKNEEKKEEKKKNDEKKNQIAIFINKFCMGRNYQ